MNFGEKIKHARELMHLTQAELSTKCSLSVPFLSEIENNKKKPSTKALVRIATALETNAAWFFDDTANEAPETAIKEALSGDEELLLFFADLAKRDDLRLLFSQVRSLKKKTIIQIIRYIKFIEDTEDAENE